MFKFAKAQKSGHVPNGIYQANIDQITFGMSKTQKPMLTAKCTIVGPEVVELGGVEYVTGNTGFMFWVLLDERSLGNVVDKMAALTMPEPDLSAATSPKEEIELYANSVINFLDNKIVDILLTSEVQYHMQTQTPEEVASGVKPVAMVGPDGQLLVNRFQVRAQLSDVQRVVEAY